MVNAEKCGAGSSCETEGVGSLKHLTLGAVMVAAVKSFQSAAETEERP